MTTKDIINNVIDELQRALEIIRSNDETKQIAFDSMLIQDIETSIERLIAIIEDI